MDLFDISTVLPSLVVKVEQAKAAIAGILKKGHPGVVAFSSGKDSSVVLALTLEVARELLALGEHPKLVVTSGETLVESPEIANHIRQESRKILAYAEKHGIDLEFHMARPSIMSSWQIKVLSGRGLPSYAGGNADCSSDLKIVPQKLLRNKLFKAWKKEGRPEPITLLGTRYDESIARALAMKERGESASEPVQNKDGDWTLSPICWWTTDEIWEFIGEVVGGERETYTDFKETMRIYADAGGTSCAVVSDAILDGLSKKKSGKCGARTGCWVCLQAYDKSLRTMVEGDSRYHYARGLVRFNEYLRAIRSDWSRRHWVGRTIKQGYLCVQPDTFHPREVRRQARMLMQLDYDEQRRAARAGEAPRFEILPLEMLVTLDAWWSLVGLAKPYSVWADLRTIHSGIRFDVPTQMPEVPDTPIPDARFLYVGDDWEGEVWDGLRDKYVEGLLEDSPCSPSVGDDGLWDLDTTPAFTVDPEGADLLLEFEVPYLLEKYDQKLPPGGITSGFKHYLGLGTLSVGHSQRRTIDEALRRTALKDRLGLTLDYKVADLVARSCRYADMPSAAREAWKHKATTASSQCELF